MPGPLNTIVLTLLEATITLYPADRSGQPLLDQPLWHGVTVADFELRDRWIKVETRPSGAKYPRKHNLAPQYEISLGRVWALPLSQLGGFNPQRGAYVMDVVWREEDSRQWHREVFYGVTISERTRGARERDGEFVEQQVFDAEYLAPITSGTGTPPALTTDLPYLVRYVSASETVDLYSYDPTTKNFTALASTADRATVAYNPDHSGSFEIQFSDELAPIHTLDTTGLTSVFFRATAPGVADVPRLDFYYGQDRCAAFTKNGAVYATAFEAVASAAVPTTVAEFRLFANDLVYCAIGRYGIRTTVFNAIGPAQIPDLKVWVRASSYPGAVGPVTADWPDESGNANHLVATGPYNGTLVFGAFPKLELDGGQPALLVRFCSTAGWSTGENYGEFRSPALIPDSAPTGIVAHVLLVARWGYDNPPPPSGPHLNTIAGIRYHTAGSPEAVLNYLSVGANKSTYEILTGTVTTYFENRLYLGNGGIGVGMGANNAPRYYRCALVYARALTNLELTRLHGFLRDQHQL